ncbi:MAG: MFS transporter [Elusimicrobiota bacterium]|jgi:predicted MFS family arabinose efflux permease
MGSWAAKWARAGPELKAFLIGILLLGANQGILSSTFNNYLSDSFRLSAAERGFLEFPRELPGFLLIFVTGALASFKMTSWAVLTGVLSAVGTVGLGYLSPSVAVMTLWMLAWAMADHLFMPVESYVGLELGREGGKGRRLGQISGARNLAMIVGAALVWALAPGGAGSYGTLYLCAAGLALASSFAFSRVRVPEDRGGSVRFVWRRSYVLFYWLNVVFGARKQIFLTFAPWVLVTQYGLSPSAMAGLILAANGLGVVFRQAFGAAVDRFGERRLFIADGLILLGICAGFALSANLALLCCLYVLDNLMFATRIARTVYLDHIAVDKGDIPATLSLGITLDHAASMTVPALGGLLWAAHGWQSVFAAAAVVALAGLGIGFCVPRFPKPAVRAAGLGQAEGAAPSAD